jgi:hypothetical protein
VKKVLLPGCKHKILFAVTALDDSILKLHW